MTFRTNEQRIKWLAMDLPDGMYWGGESGANMVDSYLEPGAFDIYTQIPATWSILIWNPVLLIYIHKFLPHIY